jgi:hypothetical protein
MAKFRVTFVVDTPDSLRAATGFKFAHDNIKCLSRKVSKIRGPLKKWEITYKGDSISYTYRSKAVAKVGLRNITTERWNHDANDYQIRIKP